MSEAVETRAYEEAVEALTRVMGEVQSVVEESPWTESVDAIRQELAGHEWRLDPVDFDVLATVNHHIDQVVYQWTIAMAMMMTKAQEARWNVLEEYWTEDDA